MLNNPNPTIRSSGHLINILRGTRDHHPNFVLFLGAGASVTSGVPSGFKLIESWREQYLDVFSTSPTDDNDQAQKSLESEPWYGTSEEYSRLFEGLFDQPSQRREYIESKLLNAHPSWGYIYLVNLLRNDIFNTVFTTNFDDLINEACYQFSSITRPIVCAHDSSIRYVRLTSKRPKIIKIHGDFLFDNIKNTVSELETLEENTKDKFRQFASEFGFIFIGYSGNDKSVMDSLQTLSRSPDNFPHGIYWCVRNESEISQQIKDLARHGKVTFIRIEGYDEFCADLHEGLGLQIQDELRDPYSCVAKRLNTLLDSARIPESKLHPLIKRDMSQLAANIKDTFETKSENQEQSKTEGDGGSTSTRKMPIPLYMLAQVAERDGKFDEALRYSKQAIKGSSPEKAFELAFRAAGQLNDIDEINNLILELRESYKAKGGEVGLFHNYSIDLIKTKHFDHAEKVLDMGLELSHGKGGFDIEYYKINKAQIYLHKSEEIPPGLKEELALICNSSANPYARFGAAIALGKEDKICSEVPELMRKGSHSVDSLLSWPIMDVLSSGGRTKVLAAIQAFYKLRPLGD